MPWVLPPSYNNVFEYLSNTMAEDTHAEWFERTRNGFNNKTIFEVLAVLHALVLPYDPDRAAQIAKLGAKYAHPPYPKLSAQPSCTFRPPIHAT